MRRLPLRLPMSAFALGLAALVSCSGGTETPTPTQPDGESATDGDAPEGVVDDPTQRVRRLREIGPSGELPTSLAIALRDRPFSDGEVGQPAPEGTVLEWDPPVEGELRISHPDALAFTPTRGFLPGTTYTATMTTLSVDGETVPVPEVDGAPAWRRSFRTPDFGLARVSLNSRDIERRQLVVDLVFTAPVDPAEVGRRLKLKMDGATVAPTRLVSGPRPSVVRATLGGQRVLDEGKLTVEVSGGLPLAWDAGTTASAQKATLDIAAGQPIEIKALMVKEGVNGHYLEVVCSDPASGGERWYWDRDSYDGWWTSSRCMALDESAQASIHVTPAVEFTVAEAPAGFRLFGDFSQGKYDITLDAGLVTVDGGVLTKAWETSMRVPERSATIGFAAKGRYLPKSAWRNLPLRHLNVSEATLTVRHVPAENLVFWLAGDEPLTTRTSNVVLEKELKLGGTVDEQQTTWLDVGAMLPTVGKGVYELSLQQKDGSARDAARLLLTDLQLLAKQAETRPGEPYAREIQAWAIDAHTTDPVSGVEVSLVRPSGKVLTRCRTDFDGACTLTVPEADVDETPPVALLARKGDDLTYLKFADLEVRSDADVSGRPWFVGAPDGDDDGVAAGYTAAAWTDRGVYRPGETAHVAALLRAEGFGAPDAGLPVTVKLFDPRGKEMRRTVAKTDASGLLTQDLAFADFATTGSYRVALEVAEREVGNVRFSVEEFVPERMEVTAEISGDGQRFAEAVPVEVGGRWLFGGSAEGSRVELDCRVESAPFKPAKNGAYHYGPADVGDRSVRPISLGAVTGELGEGGTGTFTCPAADRGGATMGPSRLVADASVFEGDSGRTTRAVATTPLHPADVYVGTRSNLDTLKAGQTATIDGVVVDWLGAVAPRLAPAEVEVEIFRLDEEYGWWWDDDDQSSSYRRLLRRVSLDQTTAAVTDGRFEVKLSTPADASGWIVVVSAGDARTEQHIDGAGGRFWWSPRDSTVDQTPRPRRPTPLALSMPDQAKVGAKVTVAFQAPYKGRALMAIETDRVVRWEWLAVEAGAASWTFEVEDFAPNVYISAFLVKDPHLESPDAFLPDRAFGVQSLRIEPEAYTHTVSLQVPDSVRPYSPLEVGLTVKDAAGAPVTGTVTATVAVVDEGILSLTDFETPDPTKQIFARRQLGVDSFETVGWTLLMKPQGPSSRTGGDAGGAGGRVQMVKPVALWSGPVTVTNGKAKVSFDVPGYRGKLRVMAVAASADRMGHAEANVVVRDPIVVQTTLPRFLVAGDIAQIPVFLANMSGQPRDVTVRLEVEDLSTVAGTRAADPGPVVDYLGERTGSLSLADGASGTVVFQVTARRAPAAARFRVVAESGSLQSKEELELPVMPRLPEARRTQITELKGGTVDLDALVTGQGWMPGTDRTSFWVTTNPHAETLTHLRHLVRYPYGCIEQTSSSTRPLLYVSDLVEFIDPSLVADAGVDEMVQHGVDRVISMQTPSGGFGYWPGASYPSEWGTAYGTHMLLDARKAGHPVPERPLADALDWLERRIQSQDTTPDGTEAYAAYVLALGGKGNAAHAAQALKRLAEVDDKKHRYRGHGWKDEARYLLMAAMHLGGDHRHEAALKALDTTPIATSRSNSWTFYSDRRRRAMMLGVYTDLFGVPDDDRTGTTVAEQVAASLSGASARYTTQELAWGVSALGKRVQAGNAGLPDATVTLAGKAVAPSRTGKTGNQAWEVTGATAVEDLSLELGSGRAWLVTTSEGVRAKDDLPTGGQGLRVSRAWFTAAGQPLDTTRHRLGETVYVKVTLENETSDKVRNIAMVDRLPAGWEIENPRLGRGTLPDWVDEDKLWRPEHMNLRDDRVEVFGELEAKGERSVVYQVRAVTSGSFEIPDVRAEAMYDPEIWAREPGRHIDIQGPWDGFVL